MSGRTARVDRGRSHTYLLDGRHAIGVTTAIGNGLPKPALAGWAARETANYALENLEVIQDLDRESAFDLLKGAPWRERDRAARRGTEVHSLAERLTVEGDEVEIPEELVGHVDAYLDWSERWNVDEVLVEATVINRRWHYMGTLDLVADLPGLGRCLIDLKTTRSGVFPDNALQLAGYRYAETYLDPDGQEAPFPEVDWTGVLWVRADGWDLVPVQAGDLEFRQFLYCLQTASWVDLRSNLVVGSPLEPPPRMNLEVVR